MNKKKTSYTIISSNVNMYLFLSFAHLNEFSDKFCCFESQFTSNKMLLILPPKFESLLLLNMIYTVLKFMCIFP